MLWLFDTGGAQLDSWWLVWLQSNLIVHLSFNNPDATTSSWATHTVLQANWTFRAEQHPLQLIEGQNTTTSTITTSPLISADFTCRSKKGLDWCFGNENLCYIRNTSTLKESNFSSLYQCVLCWLYAAPGPVPLKYRVVQASNTINSLLKT